MKTKAEKMKHAIAHLRKGIDLLEKISQLPVEEVPDGAINLMSMVFFQKIQEVELLRKEVEVKTEQEPKKPHLTLVGK